MALKSIRERSIRSWLTIFGIIVSIAVILTLLSLSAGLSGAVEEIFDEFGRNRIYVTAGGGFQSVASGSIQEGLLKKDVEAIESLPYFKMAIPFSMRNGVKVEYSGRENYLMIQSMPTDNADAVNREYQMEENIILGRPFKEDEKGVAIAGYKVFYNKDELFPREFGLKSSVYINNNKFRIVGVYKEIGSADDNSFFIPLKDAEEMFNLTVYSAVDAVVKDGVDIHVAEEKLTRLLEKRKGEDNFQIFTPEAIIRQFNNVIGIVQGVLLAIASISLIVGAVGIANNMFTSVLEREKEIGIMKSIGASNSDVLQMFIIESGLIGLFGGIIGALMGIILSLAVGEVAAVLGYPILKALISPFDVIGVLMFAFIIGMISGFLPAWSASKKKIVDVLRDN